MKRTWVTAFPKRFRPGGRRIELERFGSVAKENHSGNGWRSALGYGTFELALYPDLAAAIES